MNQAVSAERVVANNPTNGRFVGTGQLSYKQSEFVGHVARGVKAIEAARLAGYADPHVDGWRNLNHPGIMAAIREARSRLIDGELAGQALDCMRELMTDKENTPASVRFQAAKWTLEAAGHKPASGLDGLPDPNKNLADMTLEELARFIKAGEQALQTIRAEPIDITPEPTVSAFSAQDSAQQQDDTPLDVADLLG